MARTKIVPVRFSPEQFDKLSQAAAAKGITVSDVVRQRVFPPVTPPLPAPDCPNCVGMVIEMVNIVKQCRDLLFDVPPPDWRDTYWDLSKGQYLDEWRNRLYARLPLVPGLPSRKPS